MPINDSKKKELDYNDISNLKLENGEKIQALVSVSDIIMSSLDFEEIFQKSVDLLAEKFGYSSAAIFINKPEEKRIYSYTYTNLEGNHLALRGLSKAFRSLYVDYSVTTNLIVRCILEKKILESTEMSDFLCPTVNKEIAQLIQAISRTKSLFALPIVSNDRVLGALMVGNKSPEGANHDYILLVMFCKQLAIAITNAEIYAKKKDEELVKQSIEEIKELYKSYGGDVDKKDNKKDTPNPF